MQWCVESAKCGGTPPESQDSVKPDAEGKSKQGSGQSLPDYNKIMMETWNLVSKLMDCKDIGILDINQLKNKAYKLIDSYIKNNKFK